MKAESKVAQLRCILESGDELAALRMAARFKHPLPVISRAWAAHQNPDFYRQIGEDPTVLFATGIDAIRAMCAAEELSA